ncbi:MAG TPA: glutathionylspermidine synthase family protein [Dissulfurispiraceae bacterium]|nr:glutathionylspermidine synthase family protein [Dissulfurispiraceae bacterium]
MKRLTVPPRPGWQAKFEELGFSFHSMEGGYWSEGVCYEFSAAEIDHLEEVTQELHEMCLKAVDYIISKDLFLNIGLNQQAAALVRESWKREDASIYGRFDFSYDGKGEPMLLEYNADTPTALYEASVAQWVWLEDVFPKYDQFNSIHEKLMDAFNAVKRKMPLASRLYFGCVKDHEEDLVTVEYMRDVATQAGIRSRHIYIEDIGYDPDIERFVADDGEPIDCMFKLYPWEWLLGDEFGKFINQDAITLFEPAWKMVLSNKGILPVMWEMFPGHRNLLPSYFDQSGLGADFVTKPLFAREGANIELRTKGAVISTDGTYGSEGFIYQELKELPSFGGRYPVIGSWIVNGLAAGIGIREDDTPVTKNSSNFVPHYFVD